MDRGVGGGAEHSDIPRGDVVLGRLGQEDGFRERVRRDDFPTAWQLKVGIE